ncbi:MAG TPA: peptidoglycan recognition family protein, partial [Tepidisphaeraceae bacterium]|nr:peptidoglycan recognition family protein [Tepidisphaeraceae bacterium]
MNSILTPDSTLQRFSKPGAARFSLQRRVAASLLFALCVFVVNSESFAQTTRPAIVAAADWGSNPQQIADSRKHTPKYITIHHAGVLWTGEKTPVEFVRNMQTWGQKEKAWPDLPYHFLIAPDGSIFEGRSLEYEPDTNTRYTLAGNIGVEMMGNFEAQRPSKAQLESCAKLVAWLCQDLKLELKDIRGHNDAAPNQTTCPGKDFYRYLVDGQFVGWVTALMKGENVEITPGPPLEGGPTEE